MIYKKPGEKFSHENITFHPKGKRTYTLTGIIEPYYQDEMEQTYGAAYHLIGYCDASSFAANGEKTEPMLIFHPLNRSIYQETATLAQQVGAEDYHFHRHGQTIMVKVGLLIIWVLFTGKIIIIPPG